MRSTHPSHDVFGVRRTCVSPTAIDYEIGRLLPINRRNHLNLQHLTPKSAIDDTSRERIMKGPIPKSNS
uniref:Uncharacterized protein n=1 Tax=Globisporangium ultimum (strain ATCC 200006 / CBS 805.95 / DAOM BR144) TaxID=431595 RepID=K3WLP6_GLOUD